MEKMTIWVRSRSLSVTANINKKDLGTATKDVQAAIQSIGKSAARTEY